MEKSQSAGQSGSRQRSHVFGYLDETGLLQTPDSDRFFALGLVILQSPRYAHREIIRLRNQSQFYNEFKFSSINHENIGLYKRFVDIVIGAQNLRFNALVVDKTKLATSSGYVKKYNYYAGVLIASSLDQTKNSASEYITILADDVSTNNIEDQFERVVRNRIKQDKRRNALFGICRLESHAVSEIQICDVLVGTVAYAHKISVGKASSKSAKAEFVKYLQKKMNTYSLSEAMSLRLRNGVMFRIIEK